MIPQWKKDRCKFCAAGVRSAGATRQWHLPEGASLMDATRCAAPTEADYIAELEARLKDSAEDRERLDWLQSQKYGCWGINAEPISREWVYVVESGGNSDSGKTIRAAIDAARGAK